MALGGKWLLEIVESYFKTPELTHLHKYTYGAHFVKPALVFLSSSLKLYWYIFFSLNSKE